MIRWRCIAQMLLKVMNSYSFDMLKNTTDLLQTNNNIIEFCARATFPMDSIGVKQFPLHELIFHVQRCVGNLMSKY